MQLTIKESFAALHNNIGFFSSLDTFIVKDVKHDEECQCVVSCPVEFFLPMKLLAVMFLEFFEQVDVHHSSWKFHTGFLRIRKEIRI